MNVSNYVLNGSEQNFFCKELYNKSISKVFNEETNPGKVTTTYRMFISVLDERNYTLE